MFRTTTALAMLLSLQPVSAQAEDPPAFVKALSARVIGTVSDGDFVASSYGDGKLAPRQAGHRDIATFLWLNADGMKRASVPVSNSVTAAPEILSLTADGRTAFVTERLKERGETADLVRDLAPGNRLFAIDLSTPGAASVVATAEIPASPEALAVSPDGRQVAVVSNTAEASFVTIVAFSDGKFGEAQRFDLAKLGVTGTANGPRGGVAATNVQWHPSGRALAVNVNTQNRVAFFRLASGGLVPWGAPVEVGPDPFVGRFTPDGRHYLTSDWGRNFAAKDLAGRLPTVASQVSVIRLGALEADAPRHERIGSAKTDRSAEGIAVSPDGRLVATVNMRDTLFAEGSGRFDRDGTVTLLSFDPTSGALTKAGDFPFEGVLPEGGVFDASGDHFLATVFEGRNGSAKGAGVEVFRVVKGARPSLKALGRIPMPHGVHHVDVVSRN